MRAGDLRVLIRIEEPTATAGELGGRTKSWSTFDRAWASIEALNGKEFAFARGFSATTSHSIRLRFIDRVLPTMRVAVWDETDEYATEPTEIYAITSVFDPDKRRREMVIGATRVVSP